MVTMKRMLLFSLEMLVLMIVIVPISCSSETDRASDTGMCVNNSIQIQVTLEQQLSATNERLDHIINLLNLTRRDRADEYRPQDCADVQSAGFIESGQYKVFPADGGDPIIVWCDMETDGGGWTVIQKRQDGSVDFYQGWQAYKNGFGPIYGEHWLGNGRIHRLTSQKMYALRVDLWEWDGSTSHAKYNGFFVGGPDLDYVLVLGEHIDNSGHIGDSLTFHNGRKFSTHDNDHDGTRNNCAVTYHGAWWYDACHRANLNGKYYGRREATSVHDDGMVWRSWRANFYPLKKSEMKIRPL